MSPFTVFILNRNGSVTDMIYFSGQALPESIDTFWKIAGSLPPGRVNVEQAHVSVKMTKGWEKLGPQARDTRDYVVDEEYGVMFQLSPSKTPNSSPSKADCDALEKQRGGTQFLECLTRILSLNPFRAALPEVHEDEAIKALRNFLRPSKDAIDAPVFALILAMPGSGKTRTVVEAAKMEKLRRIRLKMSNAKGALLTDVRLYLARAVSKACNCAENAIPLEHDETIVIHFDEIQHLMAKPASDVEAPVTTLSKACDEMVNPSGGDPRNWLKFVMTGTNIFTRTEIKLGSSVKTIFIPLDGAFPLNFVERLARSYDLEQFVGKGDFFERCRHNRRFTEHFLCALWDGAQGEEPVDSVSRLAYLTAFSSFRDQVSKNITEGNNIKVPKVACTVFAKILRLVPEKDVAEGLVELSITDDEEKAYIGGGGLNVRDIGDDTMKI